MLVTPKVDVRDTGSMVSGAGTAGDRPYAGGEPLELVRRWRNLGFRRVHVVDRPGEGDFQVERRCALAVLGDGAVPVSVDAAADSIDVIEPLSAAGAVGVVVGSRAITEPDWLAGVVAVYPGLLIVAAEVHGRHLVAEPPAWGASPDISDLIEELAHLPLGGLLIAERSRCAKNPAHLALLEDVAEACPFPILATGEISTFNDLHALEHRGVAEVLLGAPLHRGQLDPYRVAAEFGE